MDFQVLNQGSIFLLSPVSPAARAWVEEHIPAEGNDSQRWGGSVVVEHRYISDIVEGIQNDGLEVS